MKHATEILLNPGSDGRSFEGCAADEKRKRRVASTGTTRRFGPSGSAMAANTLREHTNAVSIKISKEECLTHMRVCPGLCTNMTLLSAFPATATCHRPPYSRSRTWCAASRHAYTEAVIGGRLADRTASDGEDVRCLGWSAEAHRPKKLALDPKRPNREWRLCVAPVSA